jgi:hypothetical protein
MLKIFMVGTNASSGAVDTLVIASEPICSSSTDSRSPPSWPLG